MTDRGSTTLVAVALVALLVTIGAGLAGIGRLVAAHVAVTAAADAAALAAAPLTFLPGDPAREAERFAAANDARLMWCRCPKFGGLTVRTVRVETANEVDLGWLGSVTVRARAAAEFDPMDLLGG